MNCPADECLCRLARNKPVGRNNTGFMIHFYDMNNKCNSPEWFAAANLTLQAYPQVDKKTIIRHHDMTYRVPTKAGRPGQRSDVARKRAYGASTEDIGGNIPPTREPIKDIGGNIPPTREPIKDIGGNIPPKCTPIWEPTWEPTCTPIWEPIREPNSGPLYKLN
ncbi:MAG: hypothetical protein VR67_06160 [Peptococcaceae bacterium BRH_c8a]|nr:MAG: hypothetical protein VR67_06160 [Peptococcaceae bacterium BRH_c8a]